MFVTWHNKWSNKTSQTTLMYLKLCELLHQFLLLFTVGQWRKDVEEDFQEIQILPRNTGQCEDWGDAARHK